VEALDIAYWKQAILDIADTIEKHRDELCKLDGAIGDGDHGTSMALGLRTAASQLQGREFSEVGALLEMVGGAFTRKVGGVTGIVFGSAFAGAGKGAAGKMETGTGDLSAMFRLALDTVKSRGKANEGDKSMVDALSPAVKALEDATSKGLNPTESLALAAAASKAGMESTSQMVAKVGRARYQGENAIGHIDAGAASIALIFESLSTTAGV